MQEDNGCKIFPRVVDAQEIAHGSRGCLARQCLEPYLQARLPHGGPTAMRTIAASRRHGTGRKECENPRLTERDGSSPNPMQGGAGKSCRCAPAQRRGVRAPRDAVKRAPRQVGGQAPGGHNGKTRCHRYPIPAREFAYRKGGWRSECLLWRAPTPLQFLLYIVQTPFHV